LLLDGSGDGLLNRQRISAYVGSENLDLRVSDIGELRRRESEHGYYPDDYHDCRDHDRYDGTFDKESVHGVRLL
jgi:hypothetical protein